MPKTKQQKAEVVSEYADMVARSSSAVFVNFQGLKVKEIEAFRKKCRAEKLDYVVAKKTLMKRAFEQAGMNVDATIMDSAVGTLFGYADEVAPAKVVGSFNKQFEALKPIGGVLEKNFIDGASVMALSKLPSKMELLGKLLGSFNAPMSGLVNVFSGPMRGFVCALSEIAKTK
jgi:large subunit ribosomal protein L10